MTLDEQFKAVREFSGVAEPYPADAQLQEVDNAQASNHRSTEEIERARFVGSAFLDAWTDQYALEDGSRIFPGLD